MTSPKASLPRVSSLIKVLEEDEALQKHFDLSDAFDILYQKVTEKQVSYIHALMINKKRFKLNEVLTSLGFPAKNFNQK